MSDGEKNIYIIREGATPGIFLCVFVDYSNNNNKSIKCIFSAEATLVVGNTPYGKRHISRIEPVYGELNILD